jgi:hypothetical protein
MSLRRTPVSLFLLTTGVLFAVTFSFFVVAERESFLTQPESYIESLKRTGTASHLIAMGTWKHFLARDPLCREAEALVIGSSRVGEVDGTVVGTSVCNLFVDGLSAPGFARMTDDLPPATPGRHPVMYVAIDHFWLWDKDEYDEVDLALLARSRTLWKVWAVIRTLGFFNMSSLRETVRRYRDEGSGNLYYPDGHLSHPRYHARKRAGIHADLSRAAIEDSVSATFNGRRVREAHLRAFEAGVRHLADKGYAVRVYWNPLPAPYVASSRRHFPELFQEPIEIVDRLATTLPLERYLAGEQTLDSSRLGCTEKDYYDPSHVDADCLRRLYRTAFGDVTPTARVGADDDATTRRTK